MNRLESREGRLYITAEYGMSEEGVVRKFWWATGVRTVHHFDDFPAEGYPAERDHNGSGVYSVDTGMPRPFVVQIVGGGKAQAEFIEDRVVPRPRVRGKTMSVCWDPVDACWKKSGRLTGWSWVKA